MGVVCVDWRGLSGRQMRPLYEASAERWLSLLGWDTVSSLAEIERGRLLGTVRGACTMAADGCPSGWAFGLSLHGTLEIGGVAASSPDATEALLDTLTAAPPAPRTVRIFALDDAPGLAAAVTHRGFMLDAYDYLACDRLERRPQADHDLHRWDAGQLTAVADLLASAYPGADVVRPFAPGGTRLEWLGYVVQLTATPGCGTLMPAASVMAWSGTQLVGMVLTTRLSQTTAHVAQIAVAAEARGQGLGRRLLDAACANAALAGCTRMSLMVQAGNAPARRLYARAGFSPAARFLSAARVG